MAEEPIPEITQPVSIVSLAHMAQSGIYFLIHDCVVVYVGQSHNIRKRLGAHLTEGKKVFDAISWVLCSKARLHQLERHYIEKLVPKYNNCGWTKVARMVCADRIENSPQPTVYVPPPDLPQRMNAEQAAQFLGISAARFHQLRRLDMVPRPHRIPGKRAKVYHAPDLQQFAEACPCLILP